MKTKGTLYKLDKFPDTDQFVVFFQLNVSSLYGRLFRGERGEESMFPCSLYQFTAVPLFLKNKLRCSPKFIFTEFPCSQKLCSMFSWSPKIFLTVPHNFSHVSFSFSSVKRSYLATTLRKYLSEVKFAYRKTAIQQGNKSARKRRLPFVTQYHPALPSRKWILIGKWHLIQNQQQLRKICKKPPRSYRTGKSLKDLLLAYRAKLWRSYNFQ